MTNSLIGTVACYGLAHQKHMSNQVYILISKAASTKSDLVIAHHFAADNWLLADMTGDSLKYLPEPLNGESHHVNGLVLI